ncbi:pectinesterase family protein [Thalassobellus sediminis]|uniref:pectinesterase family protein n=1 Tax=Thalassobellus sediminis TaxID=3367753 RepID=UPI0037913E07
MILFFLLSLSISTNGQDKNTNKFIEENQYNILVAQDGSGDYTKVQDAINAVPNNSSERTVIFIKPGIYKEKILVPSEKKKVTFLGESYKNTILTYDDHGKINPDYASTKVLAEDFFAENITFQNTIDSRKGGSQAAALRIDADRAVLYKCNITGFQDTFYLKTNTRSYIKDCIIDGTTDFIYGAGIALFENCVIRNRKDSHITASSQELGENKFGFIFKNCTIIKYPGEKVSNASLGRPWGNGANTVYLNCEIGNHIKPEGFASWSTKPDHKYFNNINTAYYGLYKGTGYNPKKLLSVVHILNDSEASKYTKENIFTANSTSAINLVGDWNPVIENSSK